MTLGKPLAQVWVHIEVVVLLVLSFFFFHKYSTGCTHSTFITPWKTSISGATGHGFCIERSEKGKRHFPATGTATDYWYRPFQTESTGGPWLWWPYYHWDLIKYTIHLVFHTPSLLPLTPHTTIQPTMSRVLFQPRTIYIDYRDAHAIPDTLIYSTLPIMHFSPTPLLPPPLPPTTFN